MSKASGRARNGAGKPAKATTTRRKPAATAKAAPAARKPEVSAEAVEPAPKPLVNGSAAPAPDVTRAAEESLRAAKPAAPVADTPVEDTPVAAMAEAVEESLALATKALEAVVAQTEAVVAQPVEQASETARAAAGDAAPGGSQAVSGMIDMHRSAIDAWVKAGTVAARTLESIGQDMAALNQSTLNAAMKGGERLLACRSFHDVVALQADFAAERLGDYVEKTRILTERAIAAAADIRAPFEAQVAKAVAATQAS